MVGYRDGFMIVLSGLYKSNTFWNAFLQLHLDLQVTQSAGENFNRADISVVFQEMYSLWTNCQKLKLAGSPVTSWSVKLFTVHTLCHKDKMLAGFFVVVTMVGVKLRLCNMPSACRSFTRTKQFLQTFQAWFCDLRKKQIVLFLPWEKNMNLWSTGCWLSSAIQWLDGS